MLLSLAALLTAFLADHFLGDPPNRFHPVAAMGSFVRAGVERVPCGRAPAQFLWGVGLVLLGGALSALPWAFLTALIQRLPELAAGILLGLALKPVFALRRLVEAGMEVRGALDGGNLIEARRLVSWHLVSRDTGELTAGQVSSAVVESLAENLTDSFFAPLLAFALGGLPLAWFYRFVNTADAMIGYHTSRYEYTGKFAARLDDLLNWLPARLAALLLIAAAWLCRLDAGSAWRAMVSQHGRTSSPNAGWTMAAAAGALGVRLEKPSTYILNGGERQPAPDDILKTIRLVHAAAILAWFFCAGLLFALALII